MTTRNLAAKLALAVVGALLLTTRAAQGIPLTNGALYVDIRPDNGAIETVTFGGADFYNPGTPVSDWGMQLGTDTSTFRLNTTTGGATLPVTTGSASGVVHVMGTYTAGGALIDFARRYELEPGADVLRVTTQMHNRGGAVTLRYFDTFDPDQGSPLGFGASTFNDVFLLGSRRIGQAFISNQLTVQIGGPSVNATVASGAPFQINSGSLLNNFFTTPFDGNGAAADQGLHLGHTFAFPAGGSIAFEYRHAYGLTPAAAQAALCSGTDTDADGITGYCDNCPSIANASQTDTDADGIGDACDTCTGSGADDSDSDGVCALADNCPVTANSTQADADADGFGDACDSCVGPGADDSDGDSTCTLIDNCPAISNPGQEDTDGNGLGDACNSAEDGDGDEWSDTLDNCPMAANPGQEDTDFNGIGNACNDSEDGDGDEWADGLDNCPMVANPGQEDTDFNGIGNACNDAEDADGDEWADAFDNCPAVANPGQEDTDFNGIGNACNDAEDGDGDEWADASDNCPDDANPLQENADGDAFGDACDSCFGPGTDDSDGDGICDLADNCPDVPNPGQENLNGNAFGEACEEQGRLDNAGCYSVSDTVAPPDGSEPTFSFIDISATGTVVPIMSHEVSAAIAIGFDFDFYGTTYSQLYVSANGFISLLPGQPEGCCGGGTLPDPVMPNAVIAGLWTHLHFSSGSVFSQTLGSAPNRQFILQFKNVSNQTSGSLDNWEIILNEGSNDILVQYGNVQSNATTAGIENESGTVGLRWAGPFPVTLTNEAVRYAPTTAAGSDPDGDALVDCLDNCPLVANPGQEDTCSASPGGDACDTDADSDGIYDSCDNCPALANPTQEDTDGSGIGDACNDAIDADGDEFEDDSDNCPSVANPGIGNTGASALNALLTGLNANNAAVSALVPNRYDFSEGATGVSINDGGNDMYDGGNVLNTNVATAIPYTNGVITASDTLFGVGSSYFTAKYAGVFVMAATDLDITRFQITGNNGADGGGNVDGAVLNALGYTLFVKRVFNAGDPSINHIVIVPGNGAGVTHSFPSNTDDNLHTIDGLGSVQTLVYVLVARANGLRLDDADAINIANEVLSNLGQADADSDGFGDACDSCTGFGIDDGDGDGVCDLADNCPLVPNPGQEDADSNDIGDACECGDGVLAGAEGCDDGNTAAGDGCSSTCTTESGYQCSTPGNPCTDIDECVAATDNCDTNAACTNSAGSFSCACNPGFQGNGTACDLAHYVSYKVRSPNKDVAGLAIDNTLPRGWVITVNDILLDDSEVDDPENFEVKKAKSLLNPAQKNLEPAPDLNGLHYLRYQMKPGKESVAPPVAGEFPAPTAHVARIWHLQNQFGTINVESKKVSSLLLPANKDLTSSPLPPDDANHFVCYQVKATADITDQTVESRPGSGVGKLRKDLQAFFEDQFDDCALDQEGGTSFAGSPVAGKCLFDLKKVKELCNPINKAAVVLPRQTTASITPSLATTPRSLLCYQAKPARKFSSAAAATLANTGVGAMIDPGQAKHAKHSVKTGNPIHTAPGNQFPSPTLVDTSSYELVCIPTSVTSIAPVTP